MVRWRRSEVMRAARAMIGCAAVVTTSSAWPSLLLSAVALTTACTGAGPPVGRADAAVPPDLTIDVSVLVGPTTVPGGAAAVATSDAATANRIDEGAQRRHGRYILFPDGTLHADVGHSLRPDVRPGTTRQLTTEQVERVWTLARQLGLADPDNGQLPGNDALIVAAPDQVVQVVNFLADGRAWRFVRRSAPDGALDPATSPFVRELAALAWVSDEPSVARRPAVVRYDFGPDPYAMYREPQGPREPRKPAETATGTTP